MVAGKYAFNLSLCLFEPNIINSVLSGFGLNLLAEIYSFTSSGTCSTVQRQQMNSFGIDGHKFEYCLHKKRNFIPLCLTVTSSQMLPRGPAISRQ